MIDCDENESLGIAQYLLGTSVAKLGRGLERGELVLRKIVISTAVELGELITLTGEIPEDKVLGGIKPVPPTTFVNGGLKYRVREQLEAMEGADIDDGGHLETIKRYIDRLEAKEPLDMIAIAVQEDEGYMLVDGNKRAIAYYEICKNGAVNGIDYPVYVLCRA